MAFNPNYNDKRDTQHPTQHYPPRDKNKNRSRKSGGKRTLSALPSRGRGRGRGQDVNAPSTSFVKASLIQRGGGSGGFNKLTAKHRPSHKKTSILRQRKPQPHPDNGRMRVDNDQDSQFINQYVNDRVAVPTIYNNNASNFDYNFQSQQNAHAGTPVFMEQMRQQQAYHENQDSQALSVDEEEHYDDDHSMDDKTRHVNSRSDKHENDDDDGEVEEEKNESERKNPSSESAMELATVQNIVPKTMISPLDEYDPCASDAETTRNSNAIMKFYRCDYYVMLNGYRICVSSRNAEFENFTPVQ